MHVPVPEDHLVNETVNSINENSCGAYIKWYIEYCSFYQTTRRHIQKDGSFNEKWILIIEKNGIPAGRWHVHWRPAIPAKFVIFNTKAS
jgi:hypothetical protein